MSTSISTIYDKYRADIAAALPNHKEIINPYLPDAGPDFDFKMGWGVSVGPAIDPGDVASCKFKVVREFAVTCTRRIYFTNSDIEDRVALEKGLLEDHYLVVKEILKSPNLNSNGNIEITNFIGDGGIEFLRFGRTDILMIQSRFETAYVESYE